jgi:hypothetical protein
MDDGGDRARRVAGADRRDGMKLFVCRLRSHYRFGRRSGDSRIAALVWSLRLTRVQWHPYWRRRARQIRAQQMAYIVANAYEVDAEWMDAPGGPFA